MRIAILQHELSPYDRPGLISSLGDVWQEQGHELLMWRGIPANAPEVDVIIPHIDLTVTPPEYQSWLEQFPAVVNRLSTDISKRNVSRNLVSADDDWDGEVIVKTNRNFGGMPERLIENAEQGQPLHQEVLQRPWKRVEQLLPEQYPVFANLSSVPFGVWRNEALIVERFIPERDGNQYCNRVALMMGDRVFTRRLYSEAKIIKGPNITRIEECDLPPGFESVRQNLGLDYGKIDFVVHGDEIHVLDVNNTPAGMNVPEIDQRIGHQLAPGINCFIEAEPRQ